MAVRVADKIMNSAKFSRASESTVMVKLTRVVNLGSFFAYFYIYIYIKKNRFFFSMRISLQEIIKKSVQRNKERGTRHLIQFEESKRGKAD